MPLPDIRISGAPRLAARAVLVVSVLLAIVEVGRVGTYGSGSMVLLATVAALLVMPLHLWHLTYGLRGDRPPHSVPTLAFMGVVNVVALVVIGPAWSFMLAVLATSALVVLRPPWSLLVLAVCACGPAIGHALHPDDTHFYAHVAYLTYSVVFRSLIQFAIVWLVAAVQQLAASRSALAAEATEQERVRLQDQVRTSLEQRLVAVADAGVAARLALAGPGVSAPMVALDRLLVQAREALSDLRDVVAGGRTPLQHEAATALASTARGRRTPIGRGLATRQAWRVFAAVHGIVLGFVLLAGVGLLIPELESHPVVSTGTWLLIVAIQMPASLAVARGEVPTYRFARVGAMIVVVAVGQSFLGGSFETAQWFIATTAVMCLNGRAAVVGAAVAITGLAVSDTLAYMVDFQGVTPYLYGWNVAYTFVIEALVVAGMYASARLVQLVTQLEETRDQLAQHAARSERRRMSRDLHDVLGQALTAISLKGDLAQRLVERDRAGAAREIEGLAELAMTMTAEVEAVARGEREVAFATETEAAVDLLRAAGVEVRTDLQVDGLDAETSSLLGWVVREGATNILRHADARECEIRAVREGGVLRLELVNDGTRVTATRPVLVRAGAASERPAGGTGLASLADRAAAASGVVAGEAVGDGRFVLRVEVPR